VFDMFSSQLFICDLVMINHKSFVRRRLFMVLEETNSVRNRMIRF
jgi:hypothetical protein